MPKEVLWFEDFVKGSRWGLAPYFVSDAEIIEFAKEFDPQPIHLDHQMALDGPTNGLCASGWHTCAILMRMMCDGFLLRANGLGSPGIDSNKWLLPVRPNETLIGHGIVDSARISQSRPHFGRCLITYHVLNPAGETVMTMACHHLFATRPEGHGA